MYRVFFSHPDAIKDQVRRIALAFDRPPDLTAFVAHRDVPRVADWLSVLERELRRCDALVAFLSPGFAQSRWCDQEVGFALGRQRKVIPISMDQGQTVGHGFLEQIQSVKTSGLTNSGIAHLIVDCLLDDDTESVRLVPVVLRALHDERDLATVRRWASRLERRRDDLSQPQCDEAKEILTRNSTVRTDPTAYSIISRAISHRYPGSGPSC